MSVLDSIIECIAQKKHFVLQGGAGSGKTETLKQTIEHVFDVNPDAKIACITHTNLAADEIVSRVGGNHTISTIHSFISSIISKYKKNIHEILFEIFILQKIERQDLDFYGNDEKLQKKTEHDNYKKLYNKYAKKLFILKGETIGKVAGKVAYDKDPIAFNEKLNKDIDDLNCDILDKVFLKDTAQIKYNETRFDSLREATFGHDSLLTISHLLFSNYPLIGKIVADKYDYIFIDEYQDTRGDAIDIFLTLLPDKSKTVIGLFGDSMQGIYDDGVGDVNSYIESGCLEKIEKEDNFRCSEQVVKFINNFRNDGLVQQVAFKTHDGVDETIENRQGTTHLVYSIYDQKKPNTWSSVDEKNVYSELLLKLIDKTEEQHADFTKLMLTNKSISEKVGFENLYKIFNARYIEVKEEIEKELKRLQLLDLAELCNAYEGENKDHNFVLSKLKLAGFVLKTIKDKKIISEHFDTLINSGFSISGALKFAFNNKLLKKSEGYLAYIDRKDQFLKEVKEDGEYQSFKEHYLQGGHTFAKISKVLPDISNEEFEEKQSMLKKENFYDEFFSEGLNFREVLCYFNYLNERTDYITMHKTKGSGIKNVMVVIDEFFWSKYNFSSLFQEDVVDEDKRSRNLKLFYVSCSRTINNLICVRLLPTEELQYISQYFDHSEYIDLSN